MNTATNPYSDHDMMTVSPVAFQEVDSITATKRNENATSSNHLLQIGDNLHHSHHHHHHHDHDVDDKTFRAEFLRVALPACQPQEGSPANTFTESELMELQEALLPQMQIAASSSSSSSQQPQNNAMNLQVTSADLLKKKPTTNQMDIRGSWEAPEPPTTPFVPTPSTDGANSQEPEIITSLSNIKIHNSTTAQLLDWHGAPQFRHSTVDTTAFRQLVRQGLWTGPTNAVCPGYLQCNLVVVPAGQIAFDFLLFCQRNPQACPLLEVCDGASSTHPITLARDADLRTDCPKYAIYRNGKLDKIVTDVTDVWPDNAVAFLIGCSFSYDGALMDAGIPLRSADASLNVPMYRTSLKCRPAGSLRGNMVVSMKPIPALQIARHVQITSQYPHAHGGPVCVGADSIGDGVISLGITDLKTPDWGDNVMDFIRPGDIPVFHACGVTPQDVLIQSAVPFAITHAAGHMFVTDVPSNMMSL